MVADRVLIAAVCVAYAVTVEAAEPKHGNFASETVEVGEATRTYRLVVPKSVDLARPAPLVVAFHGFLIDSKDLMPRYTQLNDTAQKHRFLLAYPEGVGSPKHWGIEPAKVKDDLALFDALLSRLTEMYQIDPDRVYVVGMSNGGYFAHVVGRERSKVVAAVASHSGPLGLETLVGIHAARKFPVLIIHGDEDKVLPVEWARDNRDKYRKEGHEVQYVELPGHGHWWATKADVNETIWKFFVEHPREKK